MTETLFSRPAEELGLHPENQTVRLMGLSDLSEIGALHPQNPTVRSSGTVTNQGLVQPHEVNFYSCRGIREAVLLRFAL
jgi:hypothetical protein